MTRRFFTLGSTLLLTTVALWVAGALGWMQAPNADRWSGITLAGAMTAIAAALCLRLLVPVFGMVTTGRCAVCGHRTDRGHTYCLDHLQETVNATRDLARDRTPPRPRPPALPHPRT